nr:threonine-phosphate decarboxylase CobD [Roseomonas acroporae]
MEHGGRLGAARRRFPDAPAPFLDLSTGINPVPWPLPGPMPALPPAAFSRLPEPEALEALQRAAALAYGVADPGCVVASPGTQILIGLLPRLLPLRAARILGPTYAEHALAWEAAGAAVTTVTEAGALDAGEAGTAAVLCNPNNPDGRRVPAAPLLALAARLAARGGLLVVDEAFADLEPTGGPAGDGWRSLAPALPAPGLVVLRSFGKTYGLAGLRLGFALAAPGLAARLRAALGPWAVSGPALALGTAALADRGWLRAAAARLAGDTARLDRLLAAAGLRPLGGTHLFRLAEGDAAGWYERLGRAGILVRPFAARPRWLRLGLPGDAAAWDRLEAALRG